MSTGAGAPHLPTAGSDGAEPTRDARRRRALAVLLPFALLAVAGTLRFYRVGEPPAIYFDETYYVTDARSLLDVGTEEGFAVHPPLGKWLIAGGIALLGDRPVGWRAAVALAGSATVVMTYLAGLRLFRRRGVAALAAVLLAVDGLAFTMSRIAMLDAFLALFVVTGFWLLLVDRDARWRRDPSPEDGAEGSDPRPCRVYRWLAGVAFGLALATKLSALSAIGAAGLLVLGSELAARRRATGSPWTRAWAPAGSAVVTLLVVPAAIYVASYAGWFANFSDTRVGREQCPDGVCDASATDVVAAWVGEQRAILAFHRDLEAPHPYRSPAGEWLLLRRPVAYHYEACGAGDADCTIPVGTVAHVLGVGNPLLWWLALLAYPALVWLGVARRDWRAWALLVFLAGQYVPWLLAQRPLFLFYLTPVVPFMALAVAHVCEQLAVRHGWRWVPWAVAVVAVAAFVFLYPVLAALPIDPDAWQRRMLFDTWI